MYKIAKMSLPVSCLVIGLLLSSVGSFETVAGPEQFLQGTWSDRLSVEGFPTLPMYCSYLTDIVKTKVGGPMFCTINRIELPTPNGKLVLQGTGHGTWVKEEGNEFGFTMAFFITDESGNLVGESKIRGVKRLNESMDKYTGEGVDEIMDFEGNIMAKSSWTVEGTKMVVESMK